MSPLEGVALWSIGLWFAFYLVNHAELTTGIRAAVKPALPGWFVRVVTCPLCATWWTLAALSLFLGLTPLMLWCPPVVLWAELGYQRLVSSRSAANPSQPTP